jgi:hypothetical protein
VSASSHVGRRLSANILDVTLFIFAKSTVDALAFRIFLWVLRLLDTPWHLYRLVVWLISDTFPVLVEIQV